MYVAGYAGICTELIPAPGELSEPSVSDHFVTTARRIVGFRVLQWRRNDHWRSPIRTRVLMQFERLKTRDAQPSAKTMATRSFRLDHVDFAALLRERDWRDTSDIRALADWLDTKFEIPGTGFRFGFDSIIGLMPGVGDFITTVLGAYIVVRARELGAPRRVLLLMIANLAIDALVGAVPVAGDLFDTVFKSHVRNVRLLLRWLEREEGKRGDAGFRRQHDR